MMPSKDEEEINKPGNFSKGELFLYLCDDHVGTVFYIVVLRGSVQNNIRGL
jgi:hypothetical protein